MPFFEGFQNQALAFGALLASVPLVIHLLNRRRHRPVPWAAMRFVLAAWKRTRRRAQLEDLLLLLLRMAAVALLAFALARPFTSSSSPLAALTEERRDLLLVLDVSASTGFRDGVDTVHERILARAREHLSELQSERGDRARLVVAARAPRLVSWRSPEDALSLLGTLGGPAAEPLDLDAALGEVLRLCGEDETGEGAQHVEVRLLTDLQRLSLEPAAGGPAQGAPGAPRAPDDGAEPAEPERARPLDRLQALGVRVLVEDLGAPSAFPRNLGVESVRTAGTLLGPEHPADLGVSVRNFGATAETGVRLTLFVDGERQPSRTLDVPARGAREEIFTVSFATSGHHVVEARLQNDALPADDSRFEVVRVPPSLRVLLVNGDPHPDVDRDEVGYLRTVLEPLDDSGLHGGFAPFVPRVVPPDALSTEDFDLGESDVVFAANVESLSQRAVDALERFVSRGGALVVTLGDRVVPESWNARAFRPDGTGLLPAELRRRVEVDDRRRGYFRAATFDAEHPALSFFADSRWRPLFAEVPVYAFVACAPVPGARVLARLDDEQKSPLLVEREYDRGRVLLWTTSIDTGWTRLPESPRTMVPFVHELVRYAGRDDGPSRNARVGFPVTLETDAFPRSPSLVRPDGTTRVLEGEPVETASGTWLLPPLPSIDQLGLWRVETQDGVLAVAAQLDAEEGDLARLSADELEALHPALEVVARDGDDRDDDGETARGGELWRGLLRLCLAALVVESLWAGLIGRKRGVR